MKKQHTAEAEFLSILKKNKNENIDLLKIIESYFKKKRGYVFKTPQNGNNVVLLLSGGIDSIVAWYILLRKCHLHVYPICVVQTWKGGEVLAVRAFTSYLKRRFATYFHEPIIVKISHPAYVFKERLSTRVISPEELLDSFNAGSGYISPEGLGGINALIAWNGFFYAKYLGLTKKINVQTIYCGALPSDGWVIKSQTFTYMRLTMLALAEFYQDINFQFGSVLFEKQNGANIDKRQAVTILANASLPIYATYSCDEHNFFHCGRCDSCRYRKEILKKAKIHDTTKYVNDYGGLRRLILLPHLLVKIAQTVIFIVTHRDTF